jgi:hypothetical protein
MVTMANDIVKVYGQYRMKLTPYLVKDHNNEIITSQSTGIITMYDISQKFDLLWSKSFPITEAHAALTIFESIGYYDIQ